MLQTFAFKNRNYGRLSISYGIKFLLGCFIGFFLFDKILHKAIEKNLNLRKNCFERKIYENIPFSLSFKVYIFHVLNKDEVSNGAKPHFKQIGPYIFDEYVWKTNITDDDTEDTMTFDLMKKYVFRSDMSKNLTGNEIVTILHPGRTILKSITLKNALLFHNNYTDLTFVDSLCKLQVIAAIGLTVHFEYRTFLHVAVAAIKEIFHEPKDMFWTGRVMDLLFDGIDIDCSTANPLAKLVCSEMRRSDHPSIRIIEKKRLKFSLMGGYNNTVNGRFKVARGIKDIHRTGHVLEVDGQSEMDVWEKGECNTISGTDGLLFSPLHSKDKPVSIFVKQICASLHLHYARKSSYRGVNLHTFLKEFDISATNNLSCFCRHPNKCPIRGTMDLMPCVNAPITISLPHFYHADPTLLENIGSGLEPVKEKHEFFISMEMSSGVPLAGVGRIQINIEMEPVPEIEIMANLTKMLFPIIWFEESADIPDSFVNMIKYTLILGKTLNLALKWVTMTYWLIATFTCFLIFLIDRYTDIPILLQKDSMLKYSSNLKQVAPVKTASELVNNKTLNGVGINGNDIDTEEHEKIEVPNKDAVLLLSEIVTRATSSTNKSHLQINFDKTKH